MTADFKKQQVANSEEDEDYLTCGRCLSEFPLQRITTFIEHKKQECDGPREDIRESGLQCVSCPRAFMTAVGMLKHVQFSHNLRLFLERGPFAKGIQTTNFPSILPTQQLSSPDEKVSWSETAVSPLRSSVTIRNEITMSSTSSQRKDLGTEKTSPKRTQDKTQKDVSCEHVSSGSPTTMDHTATSAENLMTKSSVKQSSTDSSINKSLVVDITDSGIYSGNISEHDSPIMLMDQYCNSQVQQSPDMSLNSSSGVSENCVPSTPVNLSVNSSDTSVNQSPTISKNQTPVTAMNLSPNSLVNQSHTVSGNQSSPSTADKSSVTSGNQLQRSSNVNSMIHLTRPPSLYTKAKPSLRPKLTTDSTQRTVQSSQPILMPVTSNRSSTHPNINLPLHLLKTGNSTSKDTSVSSADKDTTTVVGQDMGVRKVLPIVLLPRQIVMRSDAPEGSEGSTDYSCEQNRLLTTNHSSDQSQSPEKNMIPKLIPITLPDTVTSENLSFGCGQAAPKENTGEMELTEDMNSTSEVTSSLASGCDFSPHQVNTTSVTEGSGTITAPKPGEDKVVIDGFCQTEKTLDEDRGQGSEGDQACCGRQGCGVTIIPGSHENTRKCCSSVVPKKRKRHMETKHMPYSWSRYNRRRIYNTFDKSRSSSGGTIYIDLEDMGAEVTRSNKEPMADKSGEINLHLSDGKKESSRPNVSSTMTSHGSVILQPGATFSIPIPYCNTSAGGSLIHPNINSHLGSQISQKKHKLISTSASSTSATGLEEEKFTSADAGISKTSAVVGLEQPVTAGTPEVCGVSTTDESTDTTFLDSSNLYYQGRKRRYPTSRPFKCDQCDHAFNQRIHLKKHMSKHTGIKPYKCQQCDYSTVERSHLKVHIRIHTGEKPFKCTYCEYATAQNSTLKIHLKRHHGSQMLECPSCAKFFTHSDSYRVHQLEHQRELVQDAGHMANDKQESHIGNRQMKGEGYVTQKQDGENDDT